VEIVFFFRAVKSRTFFEEMKGRGVRVIRPDDLRAVTPTPDARTTSSSSTPWPPATRILPTRAHGEEASRLLRAAPPGRGFGNTEDNVLTSVAGRLARLEHRLSPEDAGRIAKRAAD